MQPGNRKVLYKYSKGVSLRCLICYKKHENTVPLFGILNVVDCVLLTTSSQPGMELDPLNTYSGHRLWSSVIDANATSGITSLK